MFWECLLHRDSPDVFSDQRYLNQAAVSSLKLIHFGHWKPHKWRSAALTPWRSLTMCNLSCFSLLTCEDIWQPWSHVKWLLNPRPLHSCCGFPASLTDGAQQRNSPLITTFSDAAEEETETLDLTSFHRFFLRWWAACLCQCRFSFYVQAITCSHSGLFLSNLVIFLLGCAASTAPWRNGFV